MTIGERIKKRRIELGMSQEELAKKIGYSSRSSINKIELDVQQLRQSKIMDIANALNTTTAYIMGWEEPLKENNSTTPSTSELSEKQKELIDIMSQLSTRNQEALLEIAGSLKKTQQPGEANQDSHQ